MASSARSVRLVLWALVALVAFGLFVRPDLLSRFVGSGETLDPCREPLAWHIRSVDARFGFTPEQLDAAVREAARVWEEAGRRSFFRHDTVGSMAIDLVYDERQAGYGELRSRAADLAELEAEVDALQSLLARIEDRVERARREHELGNSQASARAYRDAVARYNQAVQQYNGAADRYNAALEAARRGGPGEVTAGNLERRMRTVGGRVVSVRRTLTVAVAGGYEELVIVLSHELGHALGLGHVADPDALMAERYRQQDLTLPVRLTQADRDALREACGRGSSP